MYVFTIGVLLIYLGKIQTCLSNSNFDQKRCEEELKAYNECVKKYAERKKQEQISEQK